jgi:hypothetical protein
VAWGRRAYGFASPCCAFRLNDCRSSHRRQYCEIWRLKRASVVEWRVALRLCTLLDTRNTKTVLAQWLAIKKSRIVSTQCICVFCVDLRTNSDYFTVQH